MRKTKIIATLGPATESPEMLGHLIDAGMNIARLNMSHGTHDWVRRVVKDIRAAAGARSKAVGILMDTQGPAIWEVVAAHLKSRQVLSPQPRKSVKIVRAGG